MAGRGSKSEGVRPRWRWVLPLLRTNRGVDELGLVLEAGGFASRVRAPCPGLSRGRILHAERARIRKPAARSAPGSNRRAEPLSFLGLLPPLQ